MQKTDFKGAERNHRKNSLTGPISCSFGSFLLYRAIFYIAVFCFELSEQLLGSFGALKTSFDSLNRSSNNGDDFRTGQTTF